MRIIHVSPIIPEETTAGGGANWPFELARTQAEMGCEVEIWGGRSSGLRLRRTRQGNLAIYHERPVTLRPFHRSDPLFLRFLLRVAFGRSADVVHIHQYRVIQWRWLMPLAKARGMKVCLTDLGGGGWRNPPVRVGDLVDKFLVLSEYGSRFFLKGNEDQFRTEHGHWPTDHNYPGSPDRVAIVGGGLDETFFVPRRDPPHVPSYMLFVGRVNRHKGIEIAIRALGLLHERFPSLFLKIVGHKNVQRDYDNFLIEESRRSGVQDRVEFCGYLNGPDLLRTYQGASVFVLPSTYRPSDGRLLHKPELFGLVLLEAMACGVPVVCSRVGGMVESVRDGETGLVFEDQDSAGLANCIARILTDAALRDRLVKNAMRMVKEEYTWTRVAEKCLAVYRELLAK